MDIFGILTNSEKDPTGETTRKLCTYIEDKGGSFLRAGDYDNNTEVFAKSVDAILVLGGDGTLIEAARKYAFYGTPILGINLGTLGYLTSVEISDMEACIECLMHDEYSIEHRMMLTTRVYHGNRKVFSTEAMNDIVVSRSGFSKLVELKLYVNDELLDIYAADGVIVSTPTGSTGYNLAAGGPVVYPETNLMVITPICPHSLTSRSIVVSGREKIAIEIGRRRPSQREEAVLTYDGQAGIELETSDRVEIEEAVVEARMLKINNRSFYQVLRSKMGNV